MLHHYLITAFRNLWKYRFYSTLNIIGLAIGIASSLIMLSFVRSELSYDRFQPDASNIYRLIFEADISGTAVEYPVVGYPWANWVSEEIPPIESVTHFFGGLGEEILLGEEVIWEDHVLYIDSAFTDIFHLEWISGDSRRFMNAPNQVVLTQSIAEKYFGQADPIGKTLIINHWSGEISITVTGLVKDYPAQSHFTPGMLVSLATLRQAFGADHPIFNNPGFTSFYTYIKTKDPKLAQAGMTDIFNQRMDEQVKQRIKAIRLQPLTDIHLHAHSNIELEINGNSIYVRIFLLVGILILLIAAINYVNLATANAAFRVKEVGIRKAVGAFGSNITQQFLVEAGVLALISLIFGILLAEIMRWQLGANLGIYIAINYFTNPFILFLLLALVLFIGLLAGSYPALFMARLKPVSILNGTFRLGNQGKYIRQALLLVQFIIATALIIGAGIIGRQLYHIEHLDMGFEKRDQVVIPAPILPDPAETAPLLSRLKEGIKQSTGVINASATGSVPGQNRALLNVRPAGRPETEVYSPVVLPVDYDYVETMELDILHGRKFDDSFGEDNGQTVLVNETSINHMALDSPYIDTELFILPQAGSGVDSIERVKIVGVYRDMHFEPVYRTVHPMFLRIEPESFFNLIVRIHPEQRENTLSHLKKTWEAQVEGTPFEYTFLQEDLAALYVQEERLGQLINLFSILTILIACLGLFSLSAIIALKRQKEIMTRKVVGAAISDIVLLLAKPFVWLILIAFPFGAVLAWWATDLWMQSFAYRSSIGWLPFFTALVIMLLVGFITVSYHAYQAATGNPADYLHQE